ncbi:unnamed protein product, partial [Notodromas monacha]
KTLSTETDGLDQVDSEPMPRHAPSGRKEPVSKLTMQGLALIAQTITKRKNSTKVGSALPMSKTAKRGWSRSYATSSVNAITPHSTDSVFVWPTPDTASTAVPLQSLNEDEPLRREPREKELLSMLETEVFFDQSVPVHRDESDSIPYRKPVVRGSLEVASSGGWKLKQYLDSIRLPELDVVDHRLQERHFPSLRGVGLQRVSRERIENMRSNANRRQYGMGVIGRLLGRRMKASSTRSAKVKEQLDDMDDYRPYFTYWITFTQILIMIISLFSYGFGPFGFSIVEQRALVTVPSLVKQAVDYWEPANFWLGPRAILVLIIGSLEVFVDWTLRHLAACKNHQGETDFRDSFSTSLAVVARELKAADHVTCEIIGRPCCIGIHGDCRITTFEYCQFVNGYFHKNAFLCSQVSCLDSVCGMLPFYNPEKPDQFYRVFTSLFLHAGLIHLGITVLVQWYVMRDLEKMAGPLRIGIIYFTAGIGGNLASAIFIPYRADVGPAGAQFGLLACLIVEVINAWQMLRHPLQALGKLAGILLVLVVVGLLPWVDNYAHVFGFFFGFLMSYALLPFVTFGDYDRKRKILLIFVCIGVAVASFVTLMILFYVSPVYDCEVCKYFSCVPFVRDLCADQNINFNKKPEWSV